MNEVLGRFQHHPDPAIDFCVEVEELEAECYNRRVGFQPIPRDMLLTRIDRAMDFRVGGDLASIAAKDVLRQLDREVRVPS